MPAYFDENQTASVFSASFWMKAGISAAAIIAVLLLAWFVSDRNSLVFLAIGIIAALLAGAGLAYYLQRAEKQDTPARNFLRQRLELLAQNQNPGPLLESTDDELL
ncbi:hypothetical protein JW933_09695, partial [candidate division FCPU426 bacterium]|nr:hypothetical protein [candidate division FCPU426 bacterium]